jgi:hypothetical protein
MTWTRTHAVAINLPTLAISKLPQWLSVQWKSVTPSDLTACKKP